MCLGRFSVLDINAVVNQAYLINCIIALTTGVTLWLRLDCCSELGNTNIKDSPSPETSEGAVLFIA